MTSCKLETDADATGVPQFEVTPAMVDAGYAACFGFDRECFPERVMVEDVIVAALAAAPEGWLVARAPFGTIGRLDR